MILVNDVIQMVMKNKKPTLRQPKPSYEEIEEPDQ